MVFWRQYYMKNQNKLWWKAEVKARWRLTSHFNSFVEDEDNTTESQDQKIQQAKKSGYLQSTVVAWLDVLMSCTDSWEH